MGFCSTERQTGEKKKKKKKGKEKKRNQKEPPEIMSMFK
jgi:hypothetical protein